MIDLKKHFIKETIQNINKEEKLIRWVFNKSFQFYQVLKKKITKHFIWLG